LRKCGGWLCRLQTCKSDTAGDRGQDGSFQEINPLQWLPTRVGGGDFTPASILAVVCSWIC
jgi:hypothetical protein